MAWRQATTYVLVAALSACGSASGPESDPLSATSAAQPEPSEAGSASSSAIAAIQDASHETPDASVGSTRDAGAGSDARQASGAPDAQATIATDAATEDALAPGSAGVAMLFWLDALQGRVMRADPVARTAMAIVTRGTSTPDGVAVDPHGDAVYWTNMGVPSADDGFITRATLNGANATTVVPVASTFTPKQLKLEPNSKMLYWSDREGMRVMRAHTDGSGLETLVTTASGDVARADAANWAVGIAVDVAGKKIYWTQKGPDNGGKGTIRRAGIDLPQGQDSAHRTDIEILFAGLPEPIDLDLDQSKRQIYWTDRGDNTVSRAPLDPPTGVAPEARKDREILVRNAGEAIGISLDPTGGVMYYTSLEGTVSRAQLDGSDVTALFRNQGSLTGIAFVQSAPP